MPTLGTKEELQAIRDNEAEVLIKMEYPDEMARATLPRRSALSFRAVPEGFSIA